MKIRKNNNKLKIKKNKIFKKTCINCKNHHHIVMIIIKNQENNKKIMELQ